jgi:hypothetical protein
MERYLGLSTLPRNPHYRDVPACIRLDALGRDALGAACRPDPVWSLRRNAGYSEIVNRRLPSALGRADRAGALQPADVVVAGVVIHVGGCATEVIAKARKDKRRFDGVYRGAVRKRVQNAQAID